MDRHYFVVSPLYKILLHLSISTSFIRITPGHNNAQALIIINCKSIIHYWWLLQFSHEMNIINNYLLIAIEPNVWLKLQWIKLTNYIDHHSTSRIAFRQTFIGVAVGARVAYKNEWSSANRCVRLLYGILTRRRCLGFFPIRIIIYSFFPINCSFDSAFCQ